MKRNEAENKLATAAEELIKAALSETTSTNESISKEASQDLKSLIAETQKVQTGVAAAKKSCDDNLYAVTQRLYDLETTVSEIETKVAKADKSRRIEWALEHVQLLNIPRKPVFQIPGFNNNISDFLINVLFTFRRDLGKYFPDYAYNVMASPTEAAFQQFRDHVQNHLHGLLGVKPQITKQDDGKYAIFYS